MGDYTKMIVHCDVTCSKEELEKAIEELAPTESAYHCDDSLHYFENRTNFRGPHIIVSMACQGKYGRRQAEFLTWLKPFVKNGSGPSDVFAMQFTEYSPFPTFWSLSKMKEQEY